MKKLFNSIICLFFGCTPTKMLVEDESTIYTKGCSRCGNGIGLPAMWKGIYEFPPPGSTPEQKKEWELYTQQKMQDLRDSVSKPKQTCVKATK